MKREVKFRAWDGKMYHFFNLLSGLYGVPVIDVHQYTGLKDKNGNDIYEGDFITHMSRNATAPHPVVFHNGAFCGDYGLIYPFSNEHFNKYCEIEVVGNVFENPELLTNALTRISNEYRR